MKKKLAHPFSFLENHEPQETYYKCLEGFLTIFVQAIRSFLQDLRS